MAYRPVQREDVGYVESAVKRLGSGALNIGSGLSGFGEGIAEAIGFDDAADTLGGVSKGLENQSHKWIESVGGHQNFYEGKDSLKAKWDEGSLGALDIGRAITDLGFSQAPQFAFGGVAAKAGRFALSPLIAKALPSLGKKGAAYLASTAGSTTGIGAQETGSIYNEQEDKDFGQALAYGMTAGALESAGLMVGATKSGLGKFVAGELAGTGVRSAKKIAADIAIATATEGATEFTQTALEQLGADKELNYDEMIEAGIGGMMMGGGISAVTSPITNKLAINEKARIDGRNEKQAEHDAEMAEVTARHEAEAQDDKSTVSMVDGTATLDETLDAVGKKAEIDKLTQDHDVAMEAHENAADQLDAEALPQDPIHPVEEEIAAANDTTPVNVRKHASVFFETSKNFVDWSKKMTAQFGKIAKDALIRLWEYVKRIQPGLSIQDVGRKNLTRNFRQELKQAGGLKSETINEFGDRKTRKGEKGGDKFVGIVKKDGMSMDDAAQAMLERGWNIPVDEYGKADTQAFMDMLDQSGTEDIIHADDASVVAELQEREGDINVPALEDNLRKLGAEKMKLRKSKAKDAPAKLEALKEQEVELKQQIVDAKDMQEQMSAEPVFEDEGFDPETEEESLYASEPEFSDEPAPMTDDQHSRFYDEFKGLVGQEGRDDEQNARLTELQGMLNIDDKAAARIKKSLTAAPMERKAKEKKAAKPAPKKRVEKVVDTVIRNTFYPTEGLAPGATYDLDVKAIAEEFTVPEQYVWNRISEMRDEAQAEQSSRVQSERDKKREENLETLETKGALKGRRLGKGAATGQEKPPVKPGESAATEMKPTPVTKRVMSQSGEGLKVVVKRHITYFDEKTQENYAVEEGTTLTVAEAKRIADSVNTEMLAVGKEKVSAKELFHEAEFVKQKGEEKTGEIELDDFQFESSDVFEHFEDDMDTRGAAQGKAHGSPALTRDTPPWQKQLFAYAKTKFKRIRMFESYLADVITKLEGNAKIKQSKHPSATRADIDAGDKAWHDALKKEANRFLTNNEKSIEKATQELYSGIFTTDELSAEEQETLVSYRPIYDKDGNMVGGGSIAVTEAGTLADIIVADLDSIKKRFNIPKLLNFVMQQEEIASLADLKGYPESLHEFMEFTSTMDSFNPFSTEDTETQPDITAINVAERDYVKDSIEEFGGIENLTEAIKSYNRNDEEFIDSLSVLHKSIIRDLQMMFDQKTVEGEKTAERYKRVEDYLIKQINMPYDKWWSAKLKEQDRQIKESKERVKKSEKDTVEATKKLDKATKAATAANWTPFVAAVQEHAHAWPEDGGNRQKPFDAQAVVDIMLVARKQQKRYRNVTGSFADLTNDEQLAAVNYMFASSVFDSQIAREKRDMSNAINDTFQAIRTRREFLEKGTFTGTAENVEVGQSKGSMYEQPYHQTDSFFDQISGRGVIILDKDGNLSTNEWPTEAAQVIDMALEQGILDEIEQEKGWPKGKYINWLMNKYEAAYPETVSEAAILRELAEKRRRLYSIPQEKSLYKALKWEDKNNKTEITEDVLLNHISEVDKGKAEWAFAMPRETVMANLRTIFRIQREKREELSGLKEQAEKVGRDEAARQKRIAEAEAKGKKYDPVPWGDRNTVSIELARLRGEIMNRQVNHQEHITDKYVETLIKDYKELKLTKENIMSMASRVYYDRSLIRRSLNQALEKHHLSIKSSVMDTLTKQTRLSNEVSVEMARKLINIGLPAKEIKLYDEFTKGNIQGLDSLQKKHYGALLSYETALRAGTHIDTSLAQAKDEVSIAPQVHEMFQTKKTLSSFEAQLVEQNPDVTVGKLDSKIAQGFYNLIAKAFGADLSIVSSPTYRSRYIGEAIDGRPKIVVNLKTGVSFHRVFSHELFHHIVNKANPVAYQKFKESIISIVGEEEFARMAHKMAPETEQLIETSRIYPVEGQIKTIEGAGGRVIRVMKSGNRYERRRAKDYVVGEEEVLAELYAEVMHDKGFYTLLAKTFEGKILSQRLINRLLEGLISIGEVQSSVDSWSVENRMLINSDAMNQVRGLVSDLIVSGEKELQHTETRYHTPAGDFTEEELHQLMMEEKGVLKGTAKFIFTEGSKGKKDFMNNIEKLLRLGMRVIKKLKPVGIFADFMADPAQIKMVSKIAHSAELAMQEANYQVVKKHQDVFKPYNKNDLEIIHDIMVRGGIDVGTTSKPIKEGAVEAAAAFQASEIADLTSAKVQDIINTFRAYKEVSDGVWEKLKKLYPDLGEVQTHYGQSIKWRKKNGVAMDDEFDWVVMPEKSQLEGTKHFAKEMNMKDSTKDIAENHKLEYETIDPHKLFLTYIRDTQKLIAVRETIQDALSRKDAKGNPYGKVFTLEDQVKAAREGYFPVNDNAMRIFKKINLPTKFTVVVSSVDEDGVISEVETQSFQTEAEATKYEAQIEEDNAAFGGKYTTEVKTENAAQERVVSHYEIIAYNNVTKKKTVDRETYTDEGKAQSKVDNLNEKVEGFTYSLNPVEVTPDQTQASQIFFKKDMARMINVLLAKDTLRNGQVAGISGQQVMNLKNNMTSIEFAMSGFHAMTIGQEITASYASWAQKQGKQMGLLSKIPFFNLINPSFFGGEKGGAWAESEQLSHLMEAVFAEPDLKNNPAILKEATRLLGIENPDMMQLLKDFHMAGGLLHQDVSLRGDAHEKGRMKYRKPNGDPVQIIGGDVFYSMGKRDMGTITQSFKDVYNATLKEEGGTAMGAAYDTTKFAALESTTAWLMEYMIPRAKLAMWTREYTMKLEQNKAKIDAGTVTTEEIARDTMKFIEDRFGEVNWTNMWMKPAYKTFLQFTFRSFTWFTGSWRALGKAGIDMAKLGWFTAKGEKYELTEKGWWGINAVGAHMLTVAFISTIYNIAIMGQPEVPDEEETPWITKLLFPRVDRFDPQSRLTVPSYITEAYKIMRHLGIIGNEVELQKLIAGRTNSLMNNVFEIINGEDWRGVSIVDHNDNIAERSFDRMAHLLWVSPISLSTMHSQYKRKGWNKAMALGVFGFTDAPAAAKRSDATNKAFELRRKEYKGKEILPEEMLEKDNMRRAAYQYQTGNKRPLEKLIREGLVSPRQRKLLIERMPIVDGRRNPLYKDPLSQAVKGLTIKGAIEVWGFMSDAEKTKHKQEIRKKYKNMMARKDQPRKTKEEVLTMMKENDIM